MTETGFDIRKEDTLEGNAFRLCYLGQDVAQFVQKFDSTKRRRFILNYNVYIESEKQMTDCIVPAFEFFNSLKTKNLRGFTQSLKEAGQYFGTIFEGREFPVEIKAGFSDYSWEFLTDDAKEMIEKIKYHEPRTSKLTTISLDDPERARILLEWEVRNLPIYPTDKVRNRTWVRVDASDKDIATELSCLVGVITKVDIPTCQREALTLNLINLLSNFQPVSSS
jgi:hypothetical protein